MYVVVTNDNGGFHTGEFCKTAENSACEMPIATICNITHSGVSRRFCQFTEIPNTYKAHQFISIRQQCIGRYLLINLTVIWIGVRQLRVILIGMTNKSAPER